MVQLWLGVASTGCKWVPQANNYEARCQESVHVPYPCINCKRPNVIVCIRFKATL